MAVAAPLRFVAGRTGAAVVRVGRLASRPGFRSFSPVILYLLPGVYRVLGRTGSFSLFSGSSAITEPVICVSTLTFRPFSGRLSEINSQFGVDRGREVEQCQD